jgi:hypothetical protein
VALQIRAATYRGKKGYVLSGRPVGQAGGWPVSIFFETRDAAERHRAKLKAAAAKGQRAPFGSRSMFKSDAERKAAIALRKARRAPFSTANNAAGAATTIAARELDRLNRKTYRKR